MMYRSSRLELRMKIRLFRMQVILKGRKLNGGVVEAGGSVGICERDSKHLLASLWTSLFAELGEIGNRIHLLSSFVVHFRFQ